MYDDCPECGALDALDRHSPMCMHAAELGLSRLAEGEDPIPPESDPEPNAEVEEPVVELVRPAAPAPAARLNWRRLCIACGEEHVGDDFLSFGKGRVARSCAWVLDYPDTPAHVVIAGLENAINTSHEVVGGRGLAEIRARIMEGGDDDE